MCEHLERAVRGKGIPILDGHDVIALLWKPDGKGRRCACGALAVHREKMDAKRFGLVFFNARNVVLATGGPGGIYRDSVYPPGQTGSIGLALAIGAKAHNLTESQFGLASKGFRWNLSGSYQQAIPRYLSTDGSGKKGRDFLNEHFPDMKALTGAIFRKGYEWPFDASKIRNHGSSLIDLLVYQETVVRGRRVYLDFQENPSGAKGWDDFSLEGLEEEPHNFLKRTGALKPRPIERLQAINPAAIQIFLDHGVDLENNRLEIRVCAQHNNGGLKANLWWESNIRHLFPVGEVCGTHGVFRPGGSALNAGQVGSLRAALFIARRYNDPPSSLKDSLLAVAPQVRTVLQFARGAIQDPSKEGILPALAMKEIRERMSTHAAHIRDPAGLDSAVQGAWRLHENLQKDIKATFPGALPDVFRTLDLSLTHAVYLEALQEYLRQGGKSRGSFLVLDPAGDRPCKTLGENWRFQLNASDALVNQKILEVHLDDSLKVHKHWVDIRPIPKEDGVFEKVWKDHAEDNVVLPEDPDE
jgi:succinate dehydrogenase/fumarate reductase flavoprotein subunit